AFVLPGEAQEAEREGPPAETRGFVEEHRAGDRPSGGGEQRTHKGELPGADEVAGERENRLAADRRKYCFGEQQQRDAAVPDVVHDLLERDRDDRCREVHRRASMAAPAVGRPTPPARAKRATGLDPATSSLGSWRSTN